MRKLIETYRAWCKRQTKLGAWAFFISMIICCVILLTFLKETPTWPIAISQIALILFSAFASVCLLIKIHLKK